MGYVARRLLHSVVVLWAVVTILFLMFRLMPGNPLIAYISEALNEEQHREDDRHDRFAPEEGHAEIAVQEIPQIQRILFVERTVEPELGHDEPLLLFIQCCRTR